MLGQSAHCRKFGLTPTHKLRENGRRRLLVSSYLAITMVVFQTVASAVGTNP